MCNYDRPVSTLGTPLNAGTLPRPHHCMAEKGQGQPSRVHPLLPAHLHLCHLGQLYCATQAWCRACSPWCCIWQRVGPVLISAIASKGRGQLCTALVHQHGPWWQSRPGHPHGLWGQYEPWTSTQTPTAAWSQTQLWPSAAAQNGTSPWPQVSGQTTNMKLFLSTLTSPALSLFIMLKPLCFCFSPISPPHTCTS